MDSDDHLPDSLSKPSSTASSNFKINPVTDTFKRRIPGFFFHYRLLLWKSMLLRIREPWVVVAELLLPIIILIVVVGLRFSQLPVSNPPCYMVSQPLPSMGFLTYMRSIVCNFNFSCSPYDVDRLSREIVVPPWMVLMGNKLPLVTQRGPELSEALTGVSRLDPNASFTELLCDPSTMTVFGILADNNTYDQINTYCKSGQLFQYITEPLVAKQIGSSVDALLPEDVSLPAFSSTGPTKNQLQQMAELIGNSSILICGKDPSYNSYLTFLEMINQHFQLLFNDVVDTEEMGNATTPCGMMREIYKEENFRPWISRLRAALQGEVFYIPANSVTDEIMQRANTTAPMLAELKKLSEEWLASKDVIIPVVMENSSAVELIREAAKICANITLLPESLRERCRKLYAFLDPIKQDNSTHYTDTLDLISNVSTAVNNILEDCVVYDRFRGFTNETEMWQEFENATKEGRTVMVVNFTSTDKVLNMNFRMDPTIIDTTYRFKVLDKYWQPEIRSDTKSSMKFFTSGFIDLQDQIERAFIAMKAEKEPNKDLFAEDFLPTEMQFIPGPCYKSDPLLRLFLPNLPLVMVVIWLCNYVINVRAIIYEKEIRLKEFTKVMGMGNSVHWLNWFTVGFVMMTASSIIITILLKTCGIFPNTEVFLLFCCFIAYILAILPQAFMCSVLFNNANFGSVFSGIFYFILYIPYNLVIIYDLTYAPLVLLTFLPQCAFAMLFSRLMTLEIQGFGGQWHSLWANDLFDGSITIGQCLLMFIVDGALAWIAVWYFENVIPSTYGLTKKFYFPFTKSYWKELIFGRLSAPKSVERVEPMADDLDLAFHEPPGENLHIGVSVRGLTKQFGRKKLIAVNNMWVDFYENQITAFLGHNGAGKTTTISMLTGIYAATSGTAYVYGRDINYEMPEIRQNLGLCPQHNVLFDNLTVVEHIKFYGYMKGLSKEEVDAEVRQFLVSLSLEQKANTLSKNLSGGQKRRLSLAAAFVGGSKIIFLDEPTAGVDPSSRRGIWNLIFKFKANRTIILTTHHMDEADVLGDRIAIVSQGRVKASGSSLFLKSKFAKYYYLSMEKTDGMSNGPSVDTKLAEVVAGQLAGSELSTSTPTEWVFTLPANRAYDVDGFYKLFAYLEQNREKLASEFGVKAIGLTDTSLEEIFILISGDPSKIKTTSTVTQKKLAFIRKIFKNRRRNQDINILEDDEDDNSNSPDNTNTTLQSSSTSSTDADAFDNLFLEQEAHITSRGDAESVSNFPPELRSLPRLTGSKLYLQQCRAYLAKRRQCVMRSKRGWVLEVVVPSLAVVLMMLVCASYPVDRMQPLMPLSPWLMASRKDIPHLYTFFANSPAQNNKTSETSYAYATEIASPRGWSGTRCIPHDIYTLIPQKYAYCNLKNYSGPGSSLDMSDEEIQQVKDSVNVKCSCKNGDYRCPKNAYVRPPQVLLPSTDYLRNLTHYNLSDYLVKSRDDSILKRYGGLMFMVTDDGPSIVASKDVLSNATLVKGLLDTAFNNSNVTALGLQLAEFVVQGLPPTQYARVWYYNKGWPSSAAYVNMLHNMQLRMFLRKKGLVPDPENHGIATANFPLPSESGGSERGIFVTLVLELVKAVGVIFALSFTSASFSTFIIRERQCGSLAMQLLAGQNRLVYWFMSYIWDFLSILVPMAIIIIIFAIFNEQAYVGKDHIGGFTALLLAYGLVITPLMYCLTFLFHVPSVAFVSLLAINIIIAIVTAVIVHMLELLVTGENDSLQHAVAVLEKVFLIFPQFTLARGFYVLARLQTIRDYNLDKFTAKVGLWDWDALTCKIVAMLIETVIFFSLVLLISHFGGAKTCEKCCFRRFRKREAAGAMNLIDDARNAISEDVNEEIKRVENDPENTMQDVVRAINLTKYYAKTTKPAVNNLTFGVRPGECFGLLGVNGAGKTTTFSMLTTSIRPTSGTILIGDLNITDSNELTTHDVIGYCPQFDALLSQLTGSETLQFFARIHGFPEEVIPKLVDRLIDRLSLRPHAHKPAGTYSGGNLRKLSTAVATVGQPQVLLLDEPTSGMDPGAKRCLWEVIKSLQQDGCSVVLTTHSMEECEALCNRLAIMMDGQFQCFGTVAHLKQRFGEGYIIEADLGFDGLSPHTLFSGTSNIVVMDAVGRKVNYEARGKVSLAAIFKQLLALRASGKVTTFAVRQVSLDSVFVNFVRNYQKDRGQVDEFEIGSSSDNDDDDAANYHAF